jgi:holo-[acyl-carrier protein] synthase
MIIGIGNDIIDIRRVERTIERYGDRFLDRVFTETERLKSDGRAMRAASYAKRFAAKEACAKALGTGFRQGVFWRDMGVVNLPSGRPTLELTGGAAKALARLTPDRRFPDRPGDRDYLCHKDFPPRLTGLPPVLGGAIGAIAPSGVAISSQDLRRASA